MGVASIDPGDVTGGHVKIGAPSHIVRNLGVIVALAAAGAGIYTFQKISTQKDEVRLEQFDSFRAAYAEKCNVPSFAGPAPEVLRDAYLTSSILQNAMATQLAALNAGASCEDVTKAMKAVDFALPQPSATAQ
jgi:hypothetical protein